MSEEKRPTKRLCTQALETVEESLIEHPNVEGLGILRNKLNQEYRVAIYVSEIPKDEAQRAALPKTIQLPDPNEFVRTEIIEIGKVKPEERTEMEEAFKKVTAVKENKKHRTMPRSLGKEPL